VVRADVAYSPEGIVTFGGLRLNAPKLGQAALPDNNAPSHYQNQHRLYGKGQTGIHILDA
jgi:hypothetical protein